MPTIRTPKCFMCKKDSVVEVTDTEYQALLDDTLIQAALPNRDADFRELIKSGIHSKCWDELFDNMEEDLVWTCDSCRGTSETVEIDPDGTSGNCVECDRKETNV